MLLCVILVMTLSGGAMGASGYRVEFRGLLEPALSGLVEQVSKTYEKRSVLPDSMALLRRRARGDLSAIHSVLKAFGYFQAQTDVRVEQDKDVLVVFELTPGPRFTLGSVELVVHPAMAVQGVDSERTGLVSGQPFASDDIVKAVRQLGQALADNGYPQHGEPTTEVVADHARGKVDVILRVEAGPRASFGATLFPDETEVDTGYLRGLIPWKEGDLFRVSLVEQASKALFASGLFSRVIPDHSGQVSPAGKLDVAFGTSPRQYRSIRMGADYSSDFGPGGLLRWEHRNIAGAGEKLSAELRADDSRQNGGLEFRKPGLFDPDQDLVVRLDGSRERTEAYVSSSGDTSAMLMRRLNPRTEIGAGLGLRVSFLRDEVLDDTETYGLVYLPLLLRFDNRDDILDPSHGGFIALSTTPYLDILNEQSGFVRSRLSVGGVQLPYSGSPLTFGLRASVASIQGGSLEGVPADLRYYAGGGGSVRGYAYQKAGELEDGEPVGGQSSLELALEGRLRLDDVWGLVAFVDGGAAYPDRLPDLAGDFFWGVGCGVRYFTAFGPFRLDVALPLNRRKDIDDAFQVYAGIGQAF
ncbi:MAG: BamA/TamA family outer membrane protein [Proteobacteria bacterium]|nr:BamA/TamA family outer membrane protein [Pseudomonadota bacterium]